MADTIVKRTRFAIVRTGLNGSPLAPVQESAESIVADAMAKCCRIAMRPANEFDLDHRQRLIELDPSRKWRIIARISWHNGWRSRGNGGSRAARWQRGYSGSIYLPLTDHLPVRRWDEGRLVPARIKSSGISANYNPLKGKFKWAEYRRFADDPTIGTFWSFDWGDCLRAFVCHEMAHAIQKTIPRRVGRHRGIDYRTPHGTGFRSVYATLRREIVNDSPNLVQYRA